MLTSSDAFRVPVSHVSQERSQVPSPLKHQGHAGELVAAHRRSGAGQGVDKELDRSSNSIMSTDEPRGGRR
jgi:hypothetical protein